MIKTTSAGFSLIEIVVVIAIMTLLVGIAAPSFMANLNSERRTATETELESLAEGIRRYVEDTERLPQSLDDLYESSVAGFGGPYIDDPFGGRDVPRDGFRNDGWGRPYKMTRSSSTVIVLTSAGRDGAMETSDDIEREVNVRPVLRDISRRRLAIVNQAINAYNAQNLPDSPLPASAASLVGTLVSAGYLPSVEPYVRDAFGDRWVPVGTPVVEARSQNFGASSGAAGSADGGDQGDDDDDHDDDDE